MKKQSIGGKGNREGGKVIRLRKSMSHLDQYERYQLSCSQSICFDNDDLLIQECIPLKEIKMNEFVIRGSIKFICLQSQ